MLAITITVWQEGEIGIQQTVSKKKKMRVNKDMPKFFRTGNKVYGRTYKNDKQCWEEGGSITCIGVIIYGFKRQK